MPIRLQSYSKYGNKKIQEDNITFDSTKEYGRYTILKQLVKMKKITDLEVHPRFELQNSFISDQGSKERAITYSADFSYRDEHGKIHVEDCKGMKTEVYKMKRKLFLYKFRGLYQFEEL